jgi:membrane-bound lytic murein transglycosylase A
MIRHVRILVFLTLAAGLAGCGVTPVRPPVATPPPSAAFEAVPWNSIAGWSEDRFADAWPALLTSCGSGRMGAAWTDFCRQAKTIDANDEFAQRRLVEEGLRPYRVVSEIAGPKPVRSDMGLITGYYEPVLKGSRRKSGAYQTPLYAVPDDLLNIDLGELYPALKGERIRGRLQGKRVIPYPDRAQLADGKLLSSKTIVWIDSAIDAFFVQIQGSGRVQLDDGTTVRLAYADVNGHPYRAIGRYLVEHGDLTVETATAPGLRDWLNEHPERQNEVFNSNPSVVFFREEKIVDPASGPRGALGVPLTAERSIAIDPRQLPLGAPVFLATTHPQTGVPLRRLMLAQDTGGAIRGAVRADVFWGLGAVAGELAGRMRQQGALWLLWPVGQLPGKP